MKGVSLRWKELSDEEKIPFRFLSSLDRIRYEKDLYFFWTKKTIPQNMVRQLTPDPKNEEYRERALIVP